MDISTGLGLLAGAIVVLTMIFMGGDLRMFISDHAVIIIFGGSFAATLIRFPLSSMFHGLPLGAKFAFTMRRMTQRELVDEALPRSRANRGRSAWRRSRSRTLSWPRAFASSPTATMPSSSERQSRARSRQLPHPSRRRPEDLSRGRRLRPGFRHDRHADRHGADVRQHDRSL
jgi:hypothetical protein